MILTLTLRARCTIVQLWTRVKFEFDLSSAVICVARKWVQALISVQFKTTVWPLIKFWSRFKWWMPGYYCCKKIVWFKSYPAQKTSLYRIIRPLMQLYWWSVYVTFLLYLFYVIFLFNKLTNRWINCIFWWQCFVATANIWSNPNHSKKNHSYRFMRHLIQLYLWSSYLTSVLYLFSAVFLLDDLING